MRWMGAGVACVMMASLVVGAQAATMTTPAGSPSSTARISSGWSVHYASKTADGRRPPASIFEVKNGEIHAYPTQAAGSEQPNAYIVTDAEHQDYVLSLEYKWGEKKFPPRLNHVRDAGLLYHVHRERPADWPASSEAQIQEGDTGDSWAVSSQVSSFVDPKTRPLRAAGERRRAGHRGQVRRVRAHAPRPRQRIPGLEHARDHRARRPRHAHRQRRGEHARQRHQVLGRGHATPG